MSATATPEIHECCKHLNPCDALCQLENAELQLAMGKNLQSYKIGEESFTYKQSSLSDIRALIGIYRERCREAQGQTRRRRGGGAFMYGKNRGIHSGTCGGGC